MFSISQLDFTFLECIAFNCSQASERKCTTVYVTSEYTCCICNYDIVCLSVKSSFYIFWNKITLFLISIVIDSHNLTCVMHQHLRYTYCRVETWILWSLAIWSYFYHIFNNLLSWFVAIVYWIKSYTIWQGRQRLINGIVKVFYVILGMLL